MSSEETKEPPATAVADKNDEASNGAETGANQAGDGNVDSDKSASNVVPEDPDPVGEEDHEDPLVIDEAEERSDGADSDEKEFEPTIEMMMNDFDDERTMEEEEALEANEEDEADELAALEQEQDMPLEELLKLYSYGRPAPAESNETDEADGGKKERLRDVRPDRNRHDKNGVDSSKAKSGEDAEDKPESVDNDDAAEDDSSKTVGLGEKRRNSESPTPNSSAVQPAKKSKSELARFYEATVEGRALRSTSGGRDDVEEEESEAEDSDNEGRDYSWKKTIMIGPTYQASVPADLSCYGDTLPYENEDKKLWDPNFLPSKAVEDYLAKSEESLQASGVISLPLGAHIRDDEQALFLLLQCGYNCDEALRRRRMNAVPPADTMSLWSEEECRAFELGLRLYGKDFHMIQQQKVRTRSVGELVQFYYLWKKTERHDVFANSTRLEKKKYTLHPGTTDYMDRFIDEQDAARDRSASPTAYHSLIFGDNKKGLSLHPGSNKSPGSFSNGDNVRVSSQTTPMTSSASTGGNINLLTEMSTAAAVANGESPASEEQR